MSIVEKNMEMINARIGEISERFDAEMIDVNLFIEVFERVKLLYIGRKNLGLPYNMKKEDILSYSLKFYEELDKEFYDKMVKVIFQNYENVTFNFYNTHFSEKKLLKKNEYEKENSGNVSSYLGKANINIKYHAPSKNSDYGTVEDIFVLCHEFSHFLDMNLEINSNFCVSTFAEEKPRFYYSSSRQIFTEVIAATMETLLALYLLKETSISKRAIINELILRNNSRPNMAFFTLFVLNMVKIYKEKEAIKVSDVQAFIDKEHCATNEFDMILKKLDLSYNSVLNELRYSIDSVFSPLLIRTIVENKGEGIKNLKEYIKFMKADDFKEAFKVYSVDFDKANYIDVILDNYNWYKYFIINLLKKYIPNGF